MKKDLKNNIIKILNEIQGAREYSNPANPRELFAIAERLISWQSWLLDYLMKSETGYRQAIVFYQTEGKSNAAATAQAKAEESYLDYKYLTNVYDLIGEQIMLIKKFVSALEQEYKQI